MARTTVYSFVTDLDPQTYRRIVLPHRARMAASPEDDVHFELAAQLQREHLEVADVLVLSEYATEPILRYALNARDRGLFVAFDLGYLPRVPQLLPFSEVVAQMHPHLEFMLSIADLVTVPTPGLAEETRAYSRAVAVVEDRVDTTLWVANEERWRPDLPEDSMVVAGPWTAASAAELPVALSGLLRIIQDGGAYLLHCLDQPLDCVPEESQILLGPTPYLQLPAWLSSADVAIVPRVSGAFSDCLSPATVLEYGALGLPVVASPTRPHRELVDAGAPVLLAEGANEWESALRGLMADPEGRREKGLRLQEYVLQHHTLGGHAGYFAELVRALKARGDRNIPSLGDAP